MTDYLEQINVEIDLLKAEIQNIDTQLNNASSNASELQKKHMRTLLHLQNLNKRLIACEPTDEPQLVYPNVFGSEVTQGLTDYELVAGKDTLARVFVGHRLVAEPPAAQFQEAKTLKGSQGDVSGVTHLDLPSFDQPWFLSSRLDFATLRIRGPRDIDIEVPGVLGDGKFTNYAKSYSESDNVNFFIDGSQLPISGHYRFDARFYRDGLLVGTRELGRHQFHPTKDLRILIIVDTWPMPTAAWNSLFKALHYIHRNFPVRANVGVLDGDQTAGLRYFIDPRPFAVDFPEWVQVEDRLDSFNSEQEIKGKPDRAEHILTVRVQQDFEQPLGGAARPGPNARIAGVTLNVNPPADNVFATLICQEIGHNILGSAHTPDPTINDPAAFNLLDRTAISNPRSIMFSYYTDNNNTDSFFLPDDWSNIRLGLIGKNSTGPE